MVYVSNHRSHIDYLIEPLVLEDSDIRPPVIAAGINLFGGPLGFIHKHVTGAIPIRRNVKDPGYLITLKAYIAEILGRHDLMFYIEGGRSYSGELKSPKTGLVNAALSAELPDLVFVPCAIAYDLILEDFILAHQKVKRRQRPFTHELAEMVRYAVGYRSRAFVTFGEPIAGRRHRPARAARRARTGAPHPRLDRPADEGAADDGDGRGHAAVDLAGGPGVGGGLAGGHARRRLAPTWPPPTRGRSSTRPRDSSMRAASSSRKTASSACASAWC